MDLSHYCVLVAEGTTRSGRLIASGLAALRASVIVGTPNLRQGQAIRNALVAKNRNPRIHTCPLDLTNLSSVEQAIVKLKTQFPHLNALVLNADRLFWRYRKSNEGFEATYAHHVLGPLSLSLGLTDLLAQNRRSIIITFGSDQYPFTRQAFDYSMKSSTTFPTKQSPPRTVSYNPLKSYLEAKLAILMISSALRTRLHGNTATVFALDTPISMSDRHPLQLWMGYLTNQLRSPAVYAETVPHLLVSRKRMPYSGCLIREGKPSRKHGICQEIDQDQLWEQTVADLRAHSPILHATSPLYPRNLGIQGVSG
ncbi:MAG: SDR family NAD(P)-dependent oxidoreductase [Gammaproteobacteria bacterium]